MALLNVERMNELIIYFVIVRYNILGIADLEKWKEFYLENWVGSEIDKKVFFPNSKKKPGEISGR